MRSDDLAPLLAAQPSESVRFRQGIVRSWDPLTAANTVEVGGTVLTNLPTIASSTEVLTMQSGDVVGLFVVGNGATSTMYIVGRITKPGTAQSASVMSIFGIKAASVIPQESTPSVFYTDLATVGPTVSDVLITSTGRCLVILSADIVVFGPHGVTGWGEGYMSFAVTNAVPIIADPGDDKALSGSIAYSSDAASTISVTEQAQKSRVVLVTGLSAGLHTFTAKYRQQAGTAQFSRRTVAVIPF